MKMLKGADRRSGSFGQGLLLVLYLRDAKLSPEGFQVERYLAQRIHFSVYKQFAGLSADCFLSLLESIILSF